MNAKELLDSLPCETLRVIFQEVSIERYFNTCDRAASILIKSRKESIQVGSDLKESTSDLREGMSRFVNWCREKFSLELNLSNRDLISLQFYGKTFDNLETYQAIAVMRRLS